MGILRKPLPGDAGHVKNPIMSTYTAVSVLIEVVFRCRDGNTPEYPVGAHDQLRREAGEPGDL